MFKGCLCLLQPPAFRRWRQVWGRVGVEGVEAVGQG